MKNRENLKLIFMLVLVSIGYSTGIHYQKIIGLNVLSVAKGCFEFGLLSLLLGKPFSNTVLELLGSSIKHFFVLGLSSLSKVLFPFLFVNLFGLGFKLGVCTGTVISAFGLKELLPNLFIVLFSVIIMIFSSVFAYFVFNRQIYRLRIKRIDSSEIEFYKQTSKGLVIFLIILFLMLCLASFTNLGLKGFFNTVL
ncbi:MAG: hypothetical protein IKB86_06880 [Clostridia bacterium]|nr:hypothetical protein [Clostridia bacterium]